MRVFQFLFGAVLTFFASTVSAASVGLYGSTFDPPTRSEMRIIRCALGDTALPRQCQELGQEISRVVVFVKEDGGRDTLASTRERVLMVKKALEEHGDRVEVLASTPEQTAERTRALLVDQNVEQLFQLLGPEPPRVFDSIPAGHQTKVVRVLFPLERHGGALNAGRLLDNQIASGAKGVIEKLGLYHPVAEGLADLQKALFEEGWRDFLKDLESACPDTISEKICRRLSSSWSGSSLVTDDQASKMDRPEFPAQNLLIYKPSQSEDRWAEKYSKTATQYLEGDSYRKLRAVADDIAARTLQGYPYGKVPRLRKAFVQKTDSPVEPLKVTEKPVTCPAPPGPYHMDMDQYLADRFPRAFARFLQGEFRRGPSEPIDLYVHNHAIDEAYEFHLRDQFVSFYFLQTRRGQHHRNIYLAKRSKPRAYRVVFTSVRGNDRRANVLCQIDRTGVFTNYRFVESKQTQPLFVLNARGGSLRLKEDDLLLFGFKGNWSRKLATLNWERTPLVERGLDIDLFTHPAQERKVIVARNVYGDDTDIVLDTFYKKGLRRVIYLGSAGAIADYQIGDLLIPNEFIDPNSDSVTFANKLAHGFQAELSSLLTVHGQQKQGWVPTLFHETKDLLLDWRANSVGAVDIEGWHLARFARRHDDLEMGAFFVVSDQTLGDSPITETNARRAVIDASMDKLISFLAPKLVRPAAFSALSSLDRRSAP